MASDDRQGRARASVAAGALPWRGGLAQDRARWLPQVFDVAAAVRSEADARRLFPWLPVAMAAGIILYFQADGVPSPLWPALLTTALGITAISQRDSLGRFAALVAACFIAAGFTAAALRTISVAAPVLDRAAFVRLSGHVETVDAGPLGGRMVIRATAMDSAIAISRPERLRVTFRGSGPRAGDQISGQARLMPPPQPAFPGGYDFARDAYFL
ncbi:MAG: DUF4131 domain-containing protein, partial [Beijerinckiaceae bacterium]